MDLLLSIIRKHIFCCICIDDEEVESEPLVNGYQYIQEDSLSNNFHGTSHLLPPISHGNTTSLNEWPINSHRAAEKTQQASLNFCRTERKCALPAVSKEKIRYPQNSTTNSDSVYFADTRSKNIISVDSKEELIRKKDTAEADSVHFSDTASKNVVSAVSKQKLIHRQIATAKPKSIQFSDTESKKALLADSMEKLIRQKATSKPDLVNFSDTSSKNVSSADSEQKLICPQKLTYKTDSMHFSDSASKNAHSANSKENPIYRQKATTKLDSVHFLDATSKKVVSEDSKEKLINMQKTSKPESVHFSVRTSGNVSTADSKGKLIYQQKAITKTESVDLSNTLGKKVSSVVSKEKITLQKATTKPDSVHLLDTANIEVLSVDSKENPIHRRKATNKSLVTVSARLHSEFSAAPKKQESRSEPHEKVSMSSVMIMERRIQDYCSSQKILLVGEGDFSFSACLARAFGMTINMVATSLDSKAYLRSNYKNAMDNISLLRMRGCKVLHRVDATDIQNHKMIKDIQFDRIIYNFPHAGFFKYTKSDRRKNQRLVRLFMENSVKIIKEDGEIHIRHKSTSFFLQWNLKGLATEAGLVLMEEANFNASEFEGYNTKYGYEGGKFSSDKNFNCHPSCTYKFVLSKRQKKLDELSHSDLRKPVRNAQSQQKITKSKAQSIQRKSASKKLTTRQVFRTKGNQPWPRQPEVINQYPIELDQLRAHQKGLLKGYNNLLEDVKGLEQTMAADHANFA